MVKKKFIDKKKSVTYSLVYRSTEDADDAPERVLMEADRRAGGAVDVGPAADAHDAQLAGRRYPPGHPLAWLEDEAQQGEMTDARRRELIELGFPDDGYDYLRHVRVLGHGAASLEGPGGALDSSNANAVKEATPVGPSVYVPATTKQAPTEDVALYDASQLTVLQPAGEEEEAEGMLGGVTAFSRRRGEARGVDAREIEEIEAMMHQMEEETRSDDDGLIEGEGDLLDDFILAATEGTGAAWEGGDRPSDGGDGGSWTSASELESGDEEGSEYSGSEGQSGGERPAKPGSIASTYWREERTDRRKLLDVIDEGFEHLALDYDEDEIGDMEDAAEAGAIQGFADVSEFNQLLDQFLVERGGGGASTSAAGGDGSGVEQGDKPKVHSFLKEEMEAYGFSDDDAEVAIRQARAAIRRAEEEEAAGTSGRAELESVAVEEDPTRHWDCESVLSLKSNLYNHPGTISEPPRQSKNVIRLDSRGFPVGVLSGPRRGVAEVPAPVPTPAVPAVALQRKKEESAEEKKARKSAVKAGKREARVAKKELKVLYKEEAVKAQHRVATAQVQPTVLL